MSFTSDPTDVVVPCEVNYERKSTSYKMRRQWTMNEVTYLFYEKVLAHEVETCNPVLL